MELGIYLHNKSGKKYKVLGVAKHSETKEDLVVYEAMYEGNPLSDLWVRPKAMFEEEVEIDGKKVSRFQYLGED